MRLKTIALLAALLLVVGACGDDSDTASTSTTAAPTTSTTTGGTATTESPTTTSPTTTGSTGSTAVTTTTSEPATTTTTTDVETADVSATIEFRDGSVVTAEDRIEANVGDEVELLVTSDVADEVHVHGYDVFADLVPGEQVAVRFVADIPGIFEVELESSHRLLVELRVG